MSYTMKVKPLEWTNIHHFTDEPWGEANLRSRIGHHNLGPYAGSYSVYETEPGGMWAWRNSWTSDREPEGVEPTMEAAMAVCQSDFEKRILSVLAPTPPAPHKPDHDLG